MTAKQFRAMLAKLDLSQRGVARLFKVNERTSRRWALGEIKVPHDVAHKLQELLNVRVSNGQ
jgi:DNA-binding transcriptional regulator YiaG